MNILAELDRVWESKCGAGDQLETEFKFEITITYEDVSRTKKFETSVHLTYLPREEIAARRSAMKIPGNERTIIVVNDTVVRRLS